MKYHVVKFSTCGIVVNQKLLDFGPFQIKDT
jgi:hypothetical protein